MQARADIENGNDELLPSDFVEKLILTNESKIKLWRQYRDLSMTELAQKTNINIATISRIESNKREPTLQQVKDLSFVLGVDIDDLV
ncbi:putative helix-turn-helix transcriptional regulator [hydrothermal vent metagenome]|uniref:Putative helix-turn-helix transcriptional regulator n=1 Tax=hydrothermal vent metagenome TaxID=652676 RepID=A0A1W1E1C7_9ZZZZ